MGWKTVIIGTECVVSLSMNRMKVKIGEEYHNIPLTDLDTVIFSHNQMTITIPLLSKLMENNINVIVCDSKNDPMGIFQPFNNHSLAFKQLNKQINWKITRKKKLWKIIVEQKIQTELDVLYYLALDYTAVETLRQYRDSVYNDDQTNREAASARLYFGTIFGNDFKRDNPEARNYALNYGYKILASYISKCIASRGMVTQLGIHHIGESNPFNLTYDFIETFRAVVDLWVYQNIDEAFSVQHKVELIGILEAKVFVNDKWYRLTDAIEDIIDSYIGFLNGNNEKVLSIRLSKGIRFNGED
ncbi:MAG: type II CRISPR-associated endonuclease Cas1 [Faecalicoccus sp.]|nr:type II CRISPR-associated endonuclease Cas1 [Faecalicoccus sp.]